MITLFTWIILINSFVPTRAVGCCSRVTNEACKSSCQQLQELPSTVPRMQFLLTAAETCPAHLTEFWNCINNSLLDVQQMSDWPGKPCCDMARSRECRKHCSSADTKDGILRYCREKDEPSLYSCIKNQEDGSQCCSKAKSTSCSLVCQGIYLTGVGNTRATRETLGQHCRRKDRRVAQCVHRKWKPPEGSVHDMPCCDTAPTPHCRSRCRSILRTFMSENDRIDELSKACTVPQLTDPFWQCFLIKQKSKKNETMPVTRFDNAKLQCCGKAASSRCRELCTQSYKKGWTYGAEFETSCSYMQPVSTMETQMNNCLIDVDQPCKLGCSGLQFCSNFNNRPTEAFRSCSPESDRAAALAYESWKLGVIHLPQLNIFVKDITKCKPFMWRAIACALEIQPCSSTQSVMTLCKEDCMYILSWCVDPSKLSGEQTVPVLCNALPSKSIPGSCVPLDPYLTESRTTAISKNEVTHPCNPNPCMPNEICLLRKRKCKHATNCLPYVCQGACPLGQVSKVLAPKGTALRLINVNADSSKGEDCYLACQCTHHGKIENCQPMHCVKKQSCKLSSDNSKGHGEQFTLDGRQCLCNAGEIICSQRSCRPDAFSPFYTGMHGNCPMHYNPVCGDNGKTYPSRCVAKCAGMSNILGNRACSDIDMCAGKPCPTGYRCVPRPQVCLNNLTSSGPCRQYECVEEMGECNVHHHDPVCDIYSNEFNNMCMLYSHRKTMGYRGHCQKFCSSTGVVCGHDGETYSSECAAKAARVSVDYHSRCQAFGNFTGNSKSLSCSQVHCPPLSPNNCQGIIPPGGCCPICASQMLLLLDPRFLEAAAKHSKTRLLSSMDVLSALSSHMTLVECDIFGFVSISSELVVIVAPTIRQPSVLQVQACQSEAKRIYNLIRSGSPNIMSYLNLSPLLVVSMELSTLKYPVLSDSTFISDSLHEESSSSRNGNSASHVTLSFFTLWLVMLNLLIVHRTYILKL